MQLSFVMIKGDHVDRFDEFLENMGQLRTGRECGDVPGCLAWKEAARLVDSAPAPAEVLRITSDQGWTILADDTGTVTEDPAVWSAVARALGTKVVTLCSDADLWSFTVHQPEGLRRAMVVDDEVVEHGAPLAIEALFSGKAKVEDLLALVASLGIDFERLNESARYRLVEVSARAA